MANLFSRTPNKNAIISSCYVLTAVLSFVGVRFESSILNYLIITILLTAPFFFLYILFFYLKTRTLTQKVIKMLAYVFIGVLASVCTLVIFVNLFVISFLIRDGGVDMTKVEIRRQAIDSHVYVVVYRRDGGATTDLGVTIHKERRVFSGLKIVNYIEGVYHANDIILETVDGRVFVKDISFTRPVYEQEYYKEGGVLRDGVALDI